MSRENLSSRVRDLLSTLIARRDLHSALWIWLPTIMTSLPSHADLVDDDTLREYVLIAGRAIDVVRLLASRPLVAADHAIIKA